MTPEDLTRALVAMEKKPRPCLLCNGAPEWIGLMLEDILGTGDSLAMVYTLCKRCNPNSPHAPSGAVQERIDAKFAQRMREATG